MDKIKTAPNRGFAKVGQKEVIWSFVMLFGISSGRRVSIWLFVVIFIISFSISSGSRQTEFYFPTFAKPCSLYKRLASLAFCTTRFGFTAVVRSSPYGRPSYNCGFAKSQKKKNFRSAKNLFF